MSDYPNFLEDVLVHWLILPTGLKKADTRDLTQHQRVPFKCQFAASVSSVLYKKHYLLASITVCMSLTCDWPRHDEFLFLCAVLCVASVLGRLLGRRGPNKQTQEVHRIGYTSIKLNIVIAVVMIAARC